LAFDTAESFQGHIPARVRSMGNLETGLCIEPKRVPGSHRIRHDGTVSWIRRYQDLVRAWVILFIFSISGGVAAVQILWGHW
jgi:hypothetical protein